MSAESWRRSFLSVFQTTVVSSSTGPGTENWTSEDIGFQEVLSEDRAFLPRHQDSTPSTTLHTLVPRDSEAQLNQQQQQTLLQDAAPAGPGASLQSRNSSQAEEPLVLHRPPSPSMAAAVCLMVEDPYFDSALSSPFWEEAPKDSSEDWRGSWDVDVPSVQVNDQDLELSTAPAGRWSGLKISRGTCERLRCSPRSVSQVAEIKTRRLLLHYPNGLLSPTSWLQMQVGPPHSHGLEY